MIAPKQARSKTGSKKPTIEEARALDRRPDMKRSKFYAC
jgi:hypothetical protein